MTDLPAEVKLALAAYSLPFAVWSCPDDLLRRCAERLTGRTDVDLSKARQIMRKLDRCSYWRSTEHREQYACRVWIMLSS